MPRGLFLLLLVACDVAVEPDRTVEEPGIHAVGTRRLDIGRTVQIWYPTVSAPAEIAIEMLEIDPLRPRYQALLAAVTTECPTRRIEVALDGEPAAGPFPLVLASHCHSCTRLSNATSAIRLASHGFIVISVDHAGDTLWDSLDGNEGGLTTEALAGRVADLQRILDTETGFPFDAVDRTRVGVFGHSFGAVTAGRLAQVDDRVHAAAALAAPMENPFIPGVLAAEVAEPVLFLVAQEDNSITEFGNMFIRQNFAKAPAAAWKLEVADAGHWSVSDLTGLVAGFAPGCGAGKRQTDGEDFTYLDPVTGRAITAAYLTAFFRATLDDDPGARAYLGREFPDEIVSVEDHE
jgi:dienelactone hydrolase